MKRAGIGVAIELVGAYALSRVLSSQLYGISATGPITFAATAGRVTAVAALAAWVPARRAARVDPVESLRAE
jgi:ABC-type lipoprotein release transport system permease subunit